MTSFMRYISVISRCAAQYRNEKLSDTGLTGYQYVYILDICRNPGISQEGLSKLIYINKSNVTRQLALLEQNGYVERRCCSSDKRIVEVYPTEKAIQVYPRVLDVLHEWNDYLTVDFTDGEREIMQGLLMKIMSKAVAYVDEKKEMPE